MAAVSGSLDTLQLLLERGATTDSPGQGGLTPLHIAARVGDPALLRELLVRCDEPIITLLNGAKMAGMRQPRDCPLKCLIDAVAAHGFPERIRPLPSLTGPAPLALKYILQGTPVLVTDDGDITLRCADGGTCTAHSLVLKACSRVPRLQLCDTPGADINLDSSMPCTVTVQTVDVLLRYIYTGELADTSDEVMLALLILAGFYRINHLPQLLEQHLLAQLSADTVADLLQLVVTPGVPPLPALLRAAQHCAAQCVYRGLDCAPAIAVLMQDMLRAASDAAARAVATGFFDALLAVQAEYCDAEADAHYCDDLAAQAVEFIMESVETGENFEDYGASRTFMDGVRLAYVTNYEIGERHVITVTAPTPALKLRLEIEIRRRVYEYPRIYFDIEEAALDQAEEEEEMMESEEEEEDSESDQW